MSMDDLAKLPDTPLLWRCTCGYDWVFINKAKTKLGWRQVCTGACKPRRDRGRQG